MDGDFDSRGPIVDHGRWCHVPLVPRRSTLLPCALLLAIVLALTACGGDTEEPEAKPSATAAPEEASDATLTKDQYEERYRAAREGDTERVSDQRQALESALAQQDVDGIARALENFAQFTRSEAQELSTLRPPGDIADEHAGFVAVMRETASAYDEVAQAAADAPTPEAALAELARLQQLLGSSSTQRRARAFAQAVQEGGYDLGIGPGDSALPGQTPVQ